MMKLTAEQIKQLIKEELEKVLHEAEYLKAERAKCIDGLKNCVDRETKKIKSISGWSPKFAAEIEDEIRQQCEEAFHQCLENAPAAAVKVMMAKRSKN